MQYSWSNKQTYYVDIEPPVPPSMEGRLQEKIESAHLKPGLVYRFHIESTLFKVRILCAEIFFDDMTCIE